MTHLPPADAWVNPKKWLKFEKGVAVGINPDTPKLDLPVDDDTLLVIGQEAVAMVRGLFRPEYVWRFQKGDALTRPDIHHWYGTAADYEPGQVGGSLLPRKFRNIPPNLAYMQRQFHSTIHATCNLLTMPSFSNMHARVENYGRAHRLFEGLFGAAQNAVNSRKLFELRRAMLENNPGMIGNNEYDEIGEEIMRSEFNRNFARYRGTRTRAVRFITENPGVLDISGIDFPKRASPDKVARVLGRHSIRQPYVTFVSQLLQTA